MQSWAGRHCAMAHWKRLASVQLKASMRLACWPGAGRLWFWLGWGDDMAAAMGHRCSKQSGASWPFSAQLCMAGMVHMFRKAPKPTRLLGLALVPPLLLLLLVGVVLKPPFGDGSATAAVVPRARPSARLEKRVVDRMMMGGWGIFGRVGVDRNARYTGKQETRERASVSGRGSGREGERRRRI